MKNLNKEFLKVIREIESLDAETRFKLEKGIRLGKKNLCPLAIPRSSAEILRLFVLLKNPKIVLELGTSIGYSTLWLASGLRDGKSKIYTIESAKNKSEIAKKYFKKVKLGGKIVQIDGKILDVLPKWNKKIDLVFMDADKKNYLIYIKQLEPFLKKDSIIIADNVLDYSHLMGDYLAYIKKSKKYSNNLINVDHGLMVSVKLE